MKRLLLFDVDGTLLHAAGAGRAATGVAVADGTVVHEIPPRRYVADHQL